MARIGVFYALGAYLLWGFLPLYWKALGAVPSFEVLLHRMAWSLLFVAALLAFRQGSLRDLRQSLRLRDWGLFAVTATILSVNWWIYIWGVQAGHVVETSLGYFINPLINVVLGSLFLGERLRRGQAVAVIVATTAVLIQTAVLGRVPWIALSLATSFAFYGLLRKKAKLGALDGLAIETILMFPPALGILIWLETQSRGAFGHGEWTTSLLLGLAGVATGLPLLWFACAARRITLTTVGFLQYLAPTIQFLLGVLVFQESLGTVRAMTFAMIWAAIAIYILEAWQFRRRAPKGESSSDHGGNGPKIPLVPSSGSSAT